MPIYEYQCNHCGHKFEAIQKISDALLTDCPACNRADLKKLISAVGFRLKGGGWYETDFKKSEKKKNLHADKDKTESPATKDSSSTKTDTTTKAEKVEKTA